MSNFYLSLQHVHVDMHVHVPICIHIDMHVHVHICICTGPRLIHVTFTNMQQQLYSLKRANWGRVTHHDATEVTGLKLGNSQLNGLQHVGLYALT